MLRINRRKASTCLHRVIVRLGIASLLLASLPGPANGQATSAGKSTPANSREPDVMRDLDDAIRLIEKNEFQAFLERFAPVEILRKLRQQDLVERAAGVMNEQAQTKLRLLIVLNALKKQTPRFDKSRGLATIDFDPLANNVPELQADLHLPDTSGLKLTGLGSDHARVIDEAIRLLESGDIATFVERLFPAAEVARLRDDAQRQVLHQQFKSHPEISRSMIADFKRMQSVQPELDDQGQTALFRLAAGQGQPARTIKLQKIKGDWRLFDDSPRVAQELLRQSQLKPRSNVTPVQLELIGGNWRFVELPFLRTE